MSSCFAAELEFLGVSDRRSVTVMARVYVETASLHPHDIEDVLERHPFIRQRLERYAVLRQEIEMKVHLMEFVLAYSRAKFVLP